MRESIESKIIRLKKLLLRDGISLVTSNVTTLNQQLEYTCLNHHSFYKRLDLSLSQGIFCKKCKTSLERMENLKQISQGNGFIYQPNAISALS